MTAEQIDAEILMWRVPVRRLHEVLGVPRQLIKERWQRFREQVYSMLDEGASSQEISEATGLPITAVAAFRAQHTRGYQLPSDDDEDTESPVSGNQEDAQVAKLSLERDLQNALRDNIAQLEQGLTVVDGGTEHRCSAGFIDILCKDVKSALVIIELKLGTAKDAAVGQILGYMGALKEENDKEVRGILVAKDFDERVVKAARMVPNLELQRYQIQFSFAALD